MRLAWKLVGTAFCATTLLAVLLHVDLYLRDRAEAVGKSYRYDHPGVVASNQEVGSKIIQEKVLEHIFPPGPGERVTPVPEAQGTTGPLPPPERAGEQSVEQTKSKNLAQEQKGKEDHGRAGERVALPLPPPQGDVIQNLLLGAKTLPQASSHGLPGGERISPGSAGVARSSASIADSGKSISSTSKQEEAAPSPSPESQLPGAGALPIATAAPPEQDPHAASGGGEHSHPTTATTTLPAAQPEPYPLDFDEEPATLLEEHVIGVVVLACRRADYLERTLSGLLEARGTPLTRPSPTAQMPGEPPPQSLTKGPQHSPDDFPIVVSQDCAPNTAVSGVILQHKPQLHGHLLTQSVKPTTDAPLGPGPPPTPQSLLKRGYTKIADHFKFALTSAFKKFHQAVFLEDDLQVSPDFFGFFRASLKHLRKKESDLLCVSAWNDQGLGTLVSDPTAVHRTEIFPGLGWMATREVVVEELLPKWPPAYWDEFMRRPDVRKNRDCLRPEINRVWHFGFVGESRGQFSKYWTKIRRNEKMLDWREPALAKQFEVASSPLLYEAHLKRSLEFAKLVQNPTDLNPYAGLGSTYYLQYSDFHSYLQLAQFFGLMPDWKEGHVRGSWRHVLPLAYRGNRVFLLKDWPNVNELQQHVLSGGGGNGGGTGTGT
mmetsp:Transcript_26110/g.65812  ORF Transcript_26110/g.65812 Transcript_26110/m.65812 type:complete len:658 (+) Transcript_26110:181-2154(+)